MWSTYHVLNVLTAQSGLPGRDHVQDGEALHLSEARLQPPGEHQVRLLFCLCFFSQLRRLVCFRKDASACEFYFRLDRLALLIAPVCVVMLDC